MVSSFSVGEIWQGLALFDFAGIFPAVKHGEVDCLRLSSESPKSGKARRSHSMRSRGSKSFRFLQILSAANKQYAGARAPDRQQAAKPAAALTACIPLRCFAAFAAFSAALAYSDIAAVCCDSRIVRWQDGIAPYIISVRLVALAASLNCCVGDSLDKVSWRLILRTVSCSQLFLKNIDTFLRK